MKNKHEKILLEEINKMGARLKQLKEKQNPTPQELENIKNLALVLNELVNIQMLASN